MTCCKLEKSGRSGSAAYILVISIFTFHSAVVLKYCIKLKDCTNSLALAYKYNIIYCRLLAMFRTLNVLTLKTL